jgi:hypothetical protein
MLPFLPFGSSRSLRCSAGSLMALVLLAAAMPAQEPDKNQFIADFLKGVELNDDKLIDKAVKKSPKHAFDFCYDLGWDKRKNSAEAAAKCDRLDASWKRCFENSDTLQKLLRWIDICDAGTFEGVSKSRDQSSKLWREYTDVVSKSLVKADYQHMVQQFSQMAQNSTQWGQAIETAELWGLASVIASKMPDKTIEDRQKNLELIESMLTARKEWNYTFDSHYLTSSEFVKFEKLRIEEDIKKGAKRESEGYAKDVKGVDALLLPNAPEVKPALAFEPLANVDELDWSTRGGPTPPFWWMVSVGKEGATRKFDWFRRRDIHLARTAPNKFGVSLVPDDVKNAVEVEAPSKPKIGTFWLDAEKKIPYAMAFWLGGDREMVNEAECNLMPNVDFANVYYRSAASWTCKVGAEVLTLYDDNASGSPADGDPFEFSFKNHLLGNPAEGTIAPLFDSLRIGKGPRMPHSQFVKLATGWHHLKRVGDQDLVLRPLNPEYVKTGKIKLAWAGPKPTTPVQLVVRGSGDYTGAYFDVSGGKEVEVPAGDYAVVWGRVVVGKAPRVQSTMLYAGNSKPFPVEAGKVYDLRMGAPFTLQFERTGEDTVDIPAAKVMVSEASGCVFTDNFGMANACEVLAAKEADGKGAKVVGKFLRFTDPEFVNVASKAYDQLGLLVACMPLPEGYKSGELILKVKLPAPGMKLQLAAKKHPLFGPISSIWQ